MKRNKKNPFKISVLAISLVLSFIFILGQVSCCFKLGLGETSASGKTAAGETSAEASAETTAEQNQPFAGVPGTYIISKLKVPGQAIDVKTAGNYAYLTSDLGILYIIDINNKEKPEIIGKCSGIDSANVVIVQGDYAYVSYTKWIFPENTTAGSSTDNSSGVKVYSICGFKIVDIKDKKNPKIIGDYISGDKEEKSVQGFFIKDNYAYLDSTKTLGMSEESKLEIISIENKSKPEIIGSCKIDGIPSGLYVEGDYAYVNNSYYDYQNKQYKKESKLFIVDIKNKNNPAVIGSCDVPANSWSVFVNRDIAYLTSSIYDEETKKYNESVLQIVDVKDKSSPATKGKIEIPGGAWEMDIKDNYLFISNNAGGVNVLDIGDSNKPVMVNRLNTAGNSYDIFISGNYGYLADGFGGFIIIGLQKENVEGQEPQIEKGEGGQKNNSAPKAEINVSGDKLSKDYFSVENPVYFDAWDSYDPDGDNLTYKWKVNGKDVTGSTMDSMVSESGEELSCLFKNEGIYDISLTVSDGSLSNETTEEVKIENQNGVIKQIKEHNFDVEIECNLTNKSDKLLRDIECFLRIPQTNSPYQIINSSTPNIGSIEEVFDVNWNLLTHFKFGKSTIKKGDEIKAIIDSKVTMYEFDFANLSDSNLNYELGDEDLKTYTTDDLFIDSASPVIHDAAKKVIGNETNPVIKAKLLYKFVADKLYYDYARAKDRNYKFMYASEILKVGKGVCADYAILYTALLRAAGIPSRVVGGIPVTLILDQKSKEIDVGHAWVEVKLPGYGWVPIDITQEEGFMTTNYYMDLATERGSTFLYENQTMDWTSYYYDGYKYKWDGTEVPETEQNLIFRVKNLDSLS
jgi:hypothetical protein